MQGRQRGSFRSGVDDDNTFATIGRCDQPCRSAGTRNGHTDARLSIGGGVAELFANFPWAAKQPLETREIEDNLIRPVRFIAWSEIGSHLEQRIGSRAVDRVERTEHGPTSSLRGAGPFRLRRDYGGPPKL